MTDNSSGIFVLLALAIMMFICWLSMEMGHSMAHSDPCISFCSTSGSLLTQVFVPSLAST
jgi:hypothetical protein